MCENLCRNNEQHYQRCTQLLTSVLCNSYTALDSSIFPDCPDPGLLPSSPVPPIPFPTELFFFPSHLERFCPHQDTLTVVRFLSKSIARKRNVVSAEVVFQRLHSSITLEIWKRSAR